MFLFFFNLFQKKERENEKKEFVKRLKVNNLKLQKYKHFFFDTLRKKEVKVKYQSTLGG